MVDILRTAVSGLMAAQRTLATTGHNIANANTPNYSRQRVDLVSRVPQQETGHFVGRGVDVAGITRAYDTFLTQQVRNHDASAGELRTLDELIGQIEGIVGDADSGVSPLMQNFFAAVQDVADAPDSAAAREVMISRGEALAAEFQSANGHLNQLRDFVNGGLRDSVGQINALADAIAAVNRDIVARQSGVVTPPNDLLDQRDRLLEDLSQLVQVRAVPQQDGALNVFIGSGQSLVVGHEVAHLDVTRSAANPKNVEIRHANQAPGSDLSTYLVGGKVGGYLSFRRDVLEPTQNKLGLLAIGVSETFNAQHRQGIDLNGAFGGDFFQAGAPQAIPHSNNGGTATLAVIAANVGELKSSDYQLSFNGSDYTLVRLADKEIVASGATVPIVVDGLSIDITAGTAVAGDRFLIQPTQQGAAGFDVVLNNGAEIAAASPIRTATDIGNLGSGTISAGATLDAANPDLRRSVELRFSDATTFDVIDVATGTAVATGQSYVAGGSIAFNGWEVTIGGAPQAGDSFQIVDNIGGVGDNRNALALAGLQSSRTLLDGSGSYQDVHGQLVAEVGARGSRTRSTLQSQEALLEQARNARDSVSGVNLDEEAADLLRFQQAYEASAQLIRVADSLIDTLLGMVRR